MKLAAALLATSCTSVAWERPDVPPVQVVQWPGQAEDPTLVDSVHVWRELGFVASMLYLDEQGEYSNRLHESECPRRWYTREPYPTDCQITIGVRVVPDLGGLIAGLADRAARVVLLDAEYMRTERVRRAVTAHEFGHVLLDVGHTDARGVMQPGSLLVEPTQADYDLACESLGICIDIDDL